MNRIPHFITQSTAWYDRLDEFFFFFLVFFLEKTAFDLSLRFVHYSVIKLRYFWWNYFLNNFSLLVGLLRLVCLLMVDQYVHSHFIMMILLISRMYLARYPIQTCQLSRIWRENHACYKSYKESRPKLKISRRFHKKLTMSLKTAKFIKKAFKSIHTRI